MAAKLKIPLAAQINRAASEKNIPQSILVELTHDCNLDCYYCYIRKSKTRRYLTTLEWLETLAGLAEAGGLYLILSGGEVFLRNDLIQIIREARGLKFAVSLISNGTNISRNMAKAIAALGVLDVGLSLHATSPGLHDKLSGQPGSFVRTLEALRLLVSLGVKVGIKHTVSKANCGEFRGLAKLATREHAIFECDSVVVPHGKSGISPHALSVAQIREFLRFMKMKPISSACAGNAGTNLHCDAGRSVMGISAYGDVLPCIQLPLVFGNVRTQSIKAIWHGEKARKFRVQERSVARECLECDMNSFCGRCPGVSYFESGKWQGKAESICNRSRATLA